MKIFKRKLFWIISVIIIVIIFGAIKIFGGGQPVVYTTEPVKRGNLIQTVSATGNVESADDISLNFRVAGKLNFLSVKEGDKVKAGTALARLDAGSLSAQVDQYRASVMSAQADLEKIKAGSSKEDIKVTEENLAKTENDLISLEAEQVQELQTLREKALDAGNNAIFTAGVAIDKVFNNLINDNTTSNLQVNDTNLLNKIELNYYTIKIDFDIAKAAVNSANSQKTNDAIASASDSLRSFLFELNNWLNNSYSLADVIILNNSYSQTAKDTIKSDISTQQSTNNTSFASAQTAKSNLINTINSYNSQIQAAKNDIAIYQAQLDLKKAGPRDFEIKSAEAKVAQAQAQLNQALANLADYTIVAPIDGTITKVNFSLGEQTNLTEPVVKILGTEKFQIKVDIPESDIAKIKTGDKAIIELDAFGSDHPFAGTISFIEPAQTVIQDVVYYKTTVSFNKDSLNDQVKSGMSADVTITTAQKENVLYIPQRAVKLRETVLGEVPEKFVEILISENKTEEKKVAVGLRADNGLVELISGLNEGDKVVTFKKNGK
ncbi:MAG: efflux RND transporter periplasmic adaptor subunit [Patescibacteria group bacterium]